jgi:hypothetical protein
MGDMLFVGCPKLNGSVDLRKSDLSGHLKVEKSYDV